MLPTEIRYCNSVGQLLLLSSKHKEAENKFKKALDLVKDPRSRAALEMRLERATFHERGFGDRLNIVRRPEHFITD